MFLFLHFKQHGQKHFYLFYKAVVKPYGFIYQNIWVPFPSIKLAKSTRCASGQTGVATCEILLQQKKSCFFTAFFVYPLSLFLACVYLLYSNFYCKMAYSVLESPQKNSIMQLKLQLKEMEIKKIIIYWQHSLKLLL